MAKVTYWIAFRLKPKDSYGGLGYYDGPFTMGKALRAPLRRDVVWRVNLYGRINDERYTKPVKITIDIGEQTARAEMVCKMLDMQSAYHQEWAAHNRLVMAWLDDRKKALGIEGITRVDDILPADEIDNLFSRSGQLWVEAPKPSRGTLTPKEHSA